MSKWLSSLFKCQELKQENKELKKRLSWFRGSVEVTNVQEDIAGDKIHELFQNKFPDAQLYPLDGKYRATDLAVVKKITDEFLHLTKPYIRNYRDCEGYAFYYKSHLEKYAINQVAINYSRVHGYNSFFYMPDYEIKVLEPQNGRIFTVSEITERILPEEIAAEVVYIEGWRKWVTMKEAIRRGAYDTVFLQI